MALLGQAHKLRIAMDEEPGLCGFAVMRCVDFPVMNQCISISMLQDKVRKQLGFFSWQSYDMKFSMDECCL